MFWKKQRKIQEVKEAVITIVVDEVKGDFCFVSVITNVDHCLVVYLAMLDYLRTKLELEADMVYNVLVIDQKNKLDGIPLKEGDTFSFTLQLL